MSRKSLVTILAEDQPQQRFAYWYLRRLGYSRHEIYQEELPTRGGGEHWVRLQYPKIIAAYRRHAGSPRTGVVVVVDADTGSCDRRMQQLSHELSQAGTHRQGANERISHLIPKRNIETWILCLNDRRPDGHGINEDEDYKGHREARQIGEQIKPAAETFFDWSRQNAVLPAHCVPSLQAAIPEIRRLEI